MSTLLKPNPSLKQITYPSCTPMIIIYAIGPDRSMSLRHVVRRRNMLVACLLRSVKGLDLNIPDHLW